MEVKNINIDLDLGKEQFYAYLNGEKQLDDTSQEQLKAVVEKYPYFQTARLMLLKHLKDNNAAEYTSELKRSAIVCCDRRKLFYYLNDDRYARFFTQPEAEGSEGDRTEVLLDSFLEYLDSDKEKKESKTSKVESNPQLTPVDSIISTDYLAYLEQTEEKHSNNISDVKPMKHQELVDNFLEKSSNNEDLFSNRNTVSESAPKPSQSIDSLIDDDTFFTESLAQVYIKQKKYEQALAIIKRLSLNFPKKSIYFVDQIRFLEYLIYNEKNKK